MNLFTDFFQQFADLINGLEFGAVIKLFYNSLPDVFITTMGLIFCISALGFIIRFLKGWF